MFLKSLEIQGFKSFPDKVQLNFDRGITAVVGPNGSGKSNISDAVRWVLGEVSSKALRGSRMEDVIFGGAVGRKPLGFAEVSLTLDNADRALLYDGDEVKITRRYYRSGESDYLLCGKEVRLRDIHELLMDTGLGRDGYAIIGQGRIDEIVDAKSGDRREIFEEAAGISKFRFRKEESEARLADAEENLVRLRDILSELEARIGPLKEQSEKAKQYITLAAEKKTLEVGLWLQALDRQRAVLREQDNRLDLTRAQHEELTQKADETQNAIEAAYLEAQGRAAEMEQGQKRAQELEEQAARKRAQADLLRNDIRHNEETVARFTQEIAQAEDATGGREERARAVSEEIEQKETRAGELSRQLSQCESGVSGLSERGEGLGGRAQEATARLNALSSSLADARVEKNGAAATLTHLGERAGAVAQDSAARAQRAEEAKQGAGETARRMEEQAAQVETLRNGLSGYELKLSTRRERLSRLEETLRSYTLQRDGKNQRAEMLENMERHFEGFSQSVRAVMHEKERGRLSGIVGPVSKLMEVPAEYTVAVETALGFSAQHIVVETEEDAKAAIGMLKRTEGGRATFLPLGSVRGSALEERELSREQGFLGVASELVRCEERYRGVVRSLLGRTAVAEDLDCAVAIARRNGYRFRIVTLDGQLVNAGGSMTGGSASRNAGLLSRAGEIEKLRAQAREVGVRIDSLAEEKRGLSAQIASVEAAQTGARAELATAQEEAVRLEGVKARFEEQAQTLQSDLKALEEEKAAGARQSEILRETVAGCDRKIVQLTEQIEQTQREIEALGVDRERLEREREAQAQRLNALRLETVANEKDMQALRQELESIAALRRGDEQRAAALREQIADVRSRSEEAGAGIETLLREAQELHGQAEDETRRIGELAAAREEIERRSAGLRTQERGLAEEKEKLSGELARLEERRQAAQSEYDAVVARLYDEYELTRSEAEKTVPPVENPAAARQRLATVKNAVKALGSVNVGAIDEYREVSERFEFMSAQVADVEKSKKELEDLITGLTERMRTIFSEQFARINENFSETFVELFGGGKAHLELTEPEDVLSSGIEIIVQPPGKIVRNLSMLSGGERSYIAIVLYFAILKVRPAPFCVLDEIEAALDDANVARFAAYLRRMCGNTQFIVITHRRGTMDEADILYGVTMQDEGVSKLLTLHVDELVERLGLRA